MKKPVGSIPTLVKRARDIQATLDSVKPLYEELDQITIALLRAQEGLARYGVAIVDNFEKKNTAFRVARIKRYELKFGSRRFL